jgi:hypothetical protein
MSSPSMPREDSRPEIHACQRRVTGNDGLRFGECLLRTKHHGHVLCMFRAKPPVAWPAQFVWHDAPRITPVLPDSPQMVTNLSSGPPPMVVVDVAAEGVDGNANITACSSEVKMVAKPKKRTAGNVKMKKRILKAEAEGDTERLAELRFKRSGCQKDKKRALGLHGIIEGFALPRGR